MSAKPQPKLCSHCGQRRLGPVEVVEVSRSGRLGPEFARFLLCAECGDEHMAWMKRRELAIGQASR